VTSTSLAVRRPTSRSVRVRPTPGLASAHAMGILWFVNICSPYLNLVLNRPTVPDFIYAGIGLTALLLLVWAGEIRLRGSPVLWVCGTYLAYVFASNMLRGTHYGSFGYVVQGISVLTVVATFRKEAPYRVLFQWIIAGMAGLGLFLVWQSITNYVPWWAIADPIQYAGGFSRAGYGFGEKNYVSALLVLGTVFCFASVANIWIYQRVAVIVIMLCISGIYFTFSRGAIISLSVALLCYALTSVRRFGRSLLAVLIALPVITVSLASFLDLILNRFAIMGRDPQALSRVDQVSEGLRAFLQHANALDVVLFGLGPDVRFGYYATVIHNTPIGILVEQGLIGITMWFAIIGFLAVLCTNLMRHRNIYPMMALAAFLITSLLIRIEIDRMFWLLILFIDSSTLAPSGSKRRRLLHRCANAQ
jgi:O-antigen ligase